MSTNTLFICFWVLGICFIYYKFLYLVSTILVIACNYFEPSKISLWNQRSQHIAITFILLTKLYCNKPVNQKLKSHLKNIFSEIVGCLLVYNLYNQTTIYVFMYIYFSKSFGELTEKWPHSHQTSSLIWHIINTFVFFS